MQVSYLTCTPPYRHWHVLCARCRAVALAQVSDPPKDILPLDQPLTVGCRACGHQQTYAVEECFLAEARDLPQAKSEHGTVAVIAGMVAAVRLARVESREIGSGSPRVTMAIHDAVSIARMVLAKVKQG